MKRFAKVYLEISNLCNLRCSFCPGTKRPGRAMTEAEFSCLLSKLRPYTDYLYFHLMGEPLCHPLLGEFLETAGAAGFHVVLTTNGTLLREKQQLLLSAPALHRVNISLHSFEANRQDRSFARYLEDCCVFGLAAEGTIVSYRLWNQGGAEQRNGEIRAVLRRFFPEPWQENRSGLVLRPGVFLQYGDRFDWPDLSAPDGGEARFCYGLRDQLGVLCDGTVVPCCLDHEGDLALGNLLTENLEDILAAPRAQAIYGGFSGRRAVEPLCRRCGFSERFR